MMVTYPNEVGYIQNRLRNLGFGDYTDGQVEIAWRNFSYDYRFAGFLDPDPAYVDEFLLWGGFREPEQWELDEMNPRYDDIVL